MLCVLLGQVRTDLNKDRRTSRQVLGDPDHWSEVCCFDPPTPPPPQSSYSICLSSISEEKVINSVAFQLKYTSPIWQWVCSSSQILSSWTKLPLLSHYVSSQFYLLAHQLTMEPFSLSVVNSVTLRSSWDKWMRWVGRGQLDSFLPSELQTVTPGCCLN